MTRQFDVVVNPDAEDAAYRPYLVIFKYDLISGLYSTVVAPLVPREQFPGAQRPNPIVSVDSREFWLATHELFAVDRRVLRSKVATVSDHGAAIIRALDFVSPGICPRAGYLPPPERQQGWWRGVLPLSWR